MCGQSLPTATLFELIAFAKKRENPAVIVLDGLNEEDITEIMTIVERLWLTVLNVGHRTKNGSQIAVIQEKAVATQMARKLQRRCQVMYNDFIRRPKGSLLSAALTNYAEGWDIIRDNGFVVQAFDAWGEEIPAFLPTDVETSPCAISMIRIPGVYEKKLLCYSKHYFTQDGVHIEARQCYYPRGESPQEIADKNKMEKIFQKWGYRCLPVMTKHETH